MGWSLRKIIHVRFFILSICCIFKNSCLSVLLKSPLKIIAVITLMRQVAALNYLHSLRFLLVIFTYTETPHIKHHPTVDLYVLNIDETGLSVPVLNILKPTTLRIWLLQWKQIQEPQIFLFSMKNVIVKGAWQLSAYIQWTESWHNLHLSRECVHYIRH